jgi:amidase
MTNIAQLSALELAGKIRSKEISAVELTELYIDRIEEFDGEINAVIVRTFDRAREDAKAADAAQARGESLGPLHGVPMTIKESYVIKDTPSTWGIEDFRNNVSATDGLAVQRFRAAGAHFLGKTNVPLNLGDFQSYNEIYGTTGNPWDTSRTPGGSSGGSAASLAAGFCGLEAGSDIGGSIRNPAHYCGVYGHKPTYGIVPMQGHDLLEGAPQADLAVCGPLARSADDLAVALDIMAGPAQREAVGWQLSLPKADFSRLKQLRVAIWPTDVVAPVTTETADRAVMVGETLSKLGATVSDSARPNFIVEEAHRNYSTLLQSVMGASLSDESIESIELKVKNLDPADMSRDAVNARGVVMSHRSWLRANYAREQQRRAWDEFFTDWDILICPQMAGPAFKHDHRGFSQRTIDVDNTEQPYMTQLFWAGMVVNSYLPSTVFPTGPSRQGLPIGLQAVSAPYRDHRTIEFSRLIAREIGGYVPPRDYA